MKTLLSFVCAFSLLSVSASAWSEHLGEKSHASPSSRPKQEGNDCMYLPFGETVKNPNATTGRGQVVLSDDGRFRTGKDDHYWWTARDLHTGKVHIDRHHMDCNLASSKMLSFGDHALLCLSEKRDLRIAFNDHPKELMENGDLVDGSADNEPELVLRGILDLFTSVGSNDIFLMDSKGQFRKQRVNDKTGDLEKAKTLFSLKGAVNAAVSENAVAVLTKAQVSIYDYEGKKIFSVPFSGSTDPTPRITFSPDGTMVGVLDSKGHFMRIHLVSQTLRHAKVQFEMEPLLFNQSRIQLFQDGELLQLSTNFDNSMYHLRPGVSQARLFSKTDGTGRALEFQQDGKKVFFLEARERGLHPELIQNFHLECVPIVPVEKPMETARSWLEPGKFDLGQDLGKLLYLYRQHPELRSCLEYPLLLVDRKTPVTIPWIDTHGPQQPIAYSCAVPAKHLPYWRGEMTSYLKRELESVGGYDEYYWRPTEARDWSYFGRYARVVPVLSLEERQSLVERIARSVSQDRSSVDRRLAMVPAPIARDLISDSLSAFFQIPSEHTVDVQLFEHSGNSHLDVFSTEPVVGHRADGEGNRTPFSLLVTKVPLKLDGQKFKADFQVGKQHYHAQGKLSLDSVLAAEIKYDAIDPLLRDPASCKFFSGTSNFVTSDILGQLLAQDKERVARVAVVPNPEQVLNTCKKVKEKVGEGGCSNLEFGGHSAGGCGVAGIFGISGLDGGFSHQEKEFQEIIACFKSLIKPEKPVVFTSCGGYGNRQTRNMFRMARLFDRRVIAANGPCSSDGWGAHCKLGWLVVERPSKDLADQFVNAELTVTKVQQK